MKFNFKKVSAVLASGLMAVSGIGFAAAANFPAPFVSGSVANVAIVYGTGTGVSQSDVVAAGNIQRELQAYMGTGTTTGSSTTGEGVLFESGTNKLNIGDNLTAIKSVSIDGDDLPTILASSSYSNTENTEYDYDQKLDIDDRVEYTFFQDSKYASKQPSLGIKIAKGAPVLNYTLDFTEAPEDDGLTTDWTDFEDTTIQILGKTYEIVDAKNSTRAEMTFMRGVEKDVLAYKESGTYTVNGKQYTVEVTYVDSNECKFKINGEETDKLTDGTTDKISDGLEIGVTEVDYSTGATTEIMNCEFYIGAEKFKIDSTKEVEINDVPVDKLYGHIIYTSGNPIKLDKIVLEWLAEDDLFITEKSSVEMPGFGSIKLSAGPLVIPKQEEVKIEGDTTDNIELTFTIKSGTTTIPILGSNGTGAWEVVGGNGNGEGIAINATEDSGGNRFVMDLGNNASGDAYFFATYWDRSASGETYLVEISDDDDDTGVDFRDFISGADLATNVKNGTNFNIGETTFTLDVFNEDDYINITIGANTYVDRIITKEGLMIYLPLNCEFSLTRDCLAPVSPWMNLTLNTTTTYKIYMEEETKDAVLAGGEDINITVGFETDNDCQVSSIDGTAGAAGTGMRSTFAGNDYFEDQSNDKVYLTYVESDLGTYVEYDTDANPDTVKIVYHGAQVYAPVTVSELGATISSGATGISQLGGIVVSDTEVSSVLTKNLIVVGGSCINSAAAKLLGGQAYCGAAFTTKTGVGSGQYIIQSFDGAYTTGKIALLVAGFEKADTVNAQTYLITKTVDTSKTYIGTSATEATEKVAAAA